MKLSALLLTALLLVGTAASAIEITAVAPQRALPETRVSISGGPFSTQPRVFLGDQGVAVRRVQAGRLEFIVPDVPAGNYTLAVHDGNDIVMAHLVFEVLPATPEIMAISPDNLDVCSDATERTVQVSGTNFRPESRLLLDGKIVSSRFIDTGTLEFRVPDLAAGVYGIEARNPDGTTSLPHSLWINSVPEIVGVDRGADMVNNYDMIIHGKNFFYNSILLLREPENPAMGREHRLATLQAGIGAGAGSFNVMAMPGESLRYDNCTTLVYRRYPLDMQEKNLQLQIVNPDGKKTDLYSVTLP
jgi:hypothetical protein